ncbi:SulP family inorganic anion transporter [Actinomyces minihominis]|uniref:SulP family inorganic anion transporter n=1 Tax=Actinomyces minihominis TaxID=2002838 RepID=UPI001A939054|nr:SulP family inorganic anion transporter [Actinomyces minihominis]
MRRSWRKDLIAGVTVGVVALPLALAFGVSSGVGAAAGLITAIVAGFVAAVFGGSRVQVSGPTGAMVVIIAPIVAAEGVGVLPLLSVLAGLMVILGGILGLGRAISLIPWPVIEGFTLGIAVTIFMQQVPAAFGVEPIPGLNSLQGAFQAAFSASWPNAALTLGLTAGSILLILALERFAPRVPSSLVVVVVATLLLWLARWDVALIGEIPSSLPAPVLPAANLEIVGRLLPAAAAVALLAGIESLLSARIAAGMMQGGTYEPDRELFGQGLASVASGLFGGMPATGAIARTAVNVRSGARSRLAAITHALLLLIVVYAASGLVSFIPLFVLSAVLMVTTFKMVSGETIMQIMRSTRSDALVFVITATITIGLDLIWAIVIGVLVAGVLVLRHFANHSGVYRENHGAGPRVAVFRMDGSMFFGVSDRIESEISQLSGVDVVILRLSRIGVMDATGAKALADLSGDLNRRGKLVIIKGLPKQYRSLVERMGLVGEHSGSALLVDNMEDALYLAGHAESHAGLLKSIARDGSGSKSVSLRVKAVIREAEADHEALELAHQGETHQEPVEQSEAQ